MKRALVIALAVTLTVSMTACTKAAAPTAKPEPAPAPQQAQNQQPAPQKVDKLPDFAIKDLNGNEVTNEFFKSNKLTIVTVWSTTWPYCVEEIPALQEIDQLYKDKGVRVLSILTASTKPEDAKKLLAEGKATYTNIIAEGNLAEYIKKYKYVPTTLYIDKNSEHAKRFYYGSKTLDQFKTIIDDYLAEYKE